MGSLARICFILFFSLCLSSPSSQQLSPSQGLKLFRIQRALEYPSVLHGWNRYTNFCYLPKTANFSITCSGGNVTEVTIVGERPNLPGIPRRVLSANFSIDSLFTTLSRFPAIVNLTLVSLGIWGQLPAKIDRFPFLQNLNLSSNFMYKEIPAEISRLRMLKRLDLGRNFFEGSVPDLTALTALEDLDLGRNRLGPQFPVLGVNLVSLVINNNSFKASLPMGLRILTKLERIDASYNKLLGKIPSFLFSLPSMAYLDLSGNRFSGALPENLNCGTNLKFVDVSLNKLVGRPPTCLRSNSTSLTAMYSWNCLASVDSGLQHPSSYCNEQPLAVLMPPAVTTTEHTSTNTLGFLLGIVGGIAGGIILVVLVILVVLRKRRTRGDGHGALTKSIAGKPSVRNSPKITSNTNLMSPDVRFEMLGFRPYRVFEMEELEEATDNFDESNLIQERSQIQLYKGRIQDGSPVTIRRLKLKQKHSPQMLSQYMDSLSKLQHRHLVSILGHCVADGDEDHGTTSVCLVFEHVSNGTLRSHLTEWRKREMLKWPQRMQAVIGIARGIQFLHTVTDPGIYGNDLKAENILLDEILTAKIHNYNLPVSSRNKNNKAGSALQFSALEGKESNSVKNGDKEDIYQLGLILLEVITGRPATTKSDLEDTKEKLQRILTDDPIDVRELTDPSIQGTFAYDSLKVAVEVSLDCLSEELSKRPSVDDVLWNLQYSVQLQDGCASSDALSLQSCS